MTNCQNRKARLGITWQTGKKCRKTNDITNIKGFTMAFQVQTKKAKLPALEFGHEREEVQADFNDIIKSKKEVLKINDERGKLLAEISIAFEDDTFYINITQCDELGMLTDYGITKTLKLPNLPEGGYTYYRGKTDGIAEAMFITLLANIGISDEGEIPMATENSVTLHDEVTGDTLRIWLENEYLKFYKPVNKFVPKTTTAISTLI